MFRMTHNNLNVFDLDQSIAFYKEAFGLEVTRHSEAEDGSYKIVYLKGEGSHILELTWLRDRKEKYNLGDNEFHLAFETDDIDAAYKKHEAMDCICYINHKKGLYFVEDPDGYWLEVLPTK